MARKGARGDERGAGEGARERERERMSAQRATEGEEEGRKEREQRPAVWPSSRSHNTPRVIAPECSTETSSSSLLFLRHLLVRLLLLLLLRGSCARFDLIRPIRGRKSDDGCVADRAILDQESLPSRREDSEKRDRS